VKNACKSCRREGEKLFLKGERCYGTKCAMIKRPYGPGDHGPEMRRKPSEYGKQLREKQKLASIYGISAQMLEGMYTKSEKTIGSTTENLIKAVVMRIDNVAYLTGNFSSRSCARQAVSHKKVKLNGKKVSVPSIILKPGDKIICENENDPDKKISKLPAWIEYIKRDSAFSVKREPLSEELDISINESLVVEYYSR
jgi:small subunit ribosomal protein S4